jgi:catechol 2,3-dioxygenase-like lactoylglutathione lyase family enzyme
MLSHIYLGVIDFDRALAFYGNKLCVCCHDPV